MNLWKPSREAGLTLIELLITIAVLALVAAIAIPTITNVVSSTNTRAAAQQDSLVADFVSKYTKSGVYTYDDATQTYTGYVDLNGDGTVDDSEKIEELAVDTVKFAVTRTDGGDGVAPATTTTAASYDSIPDDSFTVSLTAAGVILTAPTIFATFNDTGAYRVEGYSPASNFPAPGDGVYCLVEPGCENDTALRVFLGFDAQQAGDATYESYRVELLEDPTAGSGTFTYSEFTDASTTYDWSSASVFTVARDTSTATSFYFTGLDTTKRYFWRAALVNSEGTGAFDEIRGLRYAPDHKDYNCDGFFSASPQWYHLEPIPVNSSVSNGLTEYGEDYSVCSP